mmetsp:Transcript_99668/g.281329  ORF Transcript_99668/g.281329 Transcript_99668/m.281329 type:complete len:242 (+) Transcript_99668:227-952(+)
MSQRGRTPAPARNMMTRLTPQRSTPKTMRKPTSRALSPHALKVYVCWTRSSRKEIEHACGSSSMASPTSPVRNAMRYDSRFVARELGGRQPQRRSRCSGCPHARRLQALLEQRVDLRNPVSQGLARHRELRDKVATSSPLGPTAAVCRDSDPEQTEVLEGGERCIDAALRRQVQWLVQATAQILIARANLAGPHGFCLRLDKRAQEHLLLHRQLPKAHEGIAPHFRHAGSARRWRGLWCRN